MAEHRQADVGGGRRLPPLSRASERPADRLIERARELAVIGEALERARAGTGGMVLVEGAAGLGKSRLLREALALAREAGMQVLRGRGSETEREFAFGVVTQLFEPALACEESERRALFAGAAALAQPVFELHHPKPPPGESLFSLLHGLHWLTANVAERAPLMLCVDDLHWCDEASRRFIGYVLQRLEELPIVILAATRPWETRAADDLWRAFREHPTVRELALAPLSPAGVGELVNARLSVQADESFCRACAEATGGNPFFVGEVLHALRDEGLEPSRAAAEWLHELNIESVSRSVLFRIARMGDDVAALARAVAVLGDGSALRHAAAVAELDQREAGGAADRLASVDILVRAELLSFSHPLARASVYGDITPARRGTLHLRAAVVLAGELAPPESVAAQLLTAAAGGETWVVEALRGAARVASAHGAPESAARYLARAIAEPPAPDLRAELRVELGQAEAASGGSEAVERCTEALEGVEDPAARARVLQTLGRVLAARGQEPTASRTFALALEELSDRGGDELRSELLADYLSTAALDTELRAEALARVDALDASKLSADRRGDRALLAQLAARSGQRAEPAPVTIALAGRAWAGGRLIDAEGPAGPSWALVYWALALAEDYLGAERVLDEVIDRARRLGLVLAHATAAHWRADCYLQQGRLSDALADAELAIDAQRFGWRRYLTMVQTTRVEALREQGRLEEAQRALALAAECEDARFVMSAPPRRVAAARLDLSQHDFESAYASLTELGELMSRLGIRRTVLPWRPFAALAALQTGRRERARELIDAELELAGRAQAPVSLGRALRIAGLIEGGERGIELLERSVGELRPTAAQLELAHALVDLGSALRREAHRRDSRAPLEEGLALAVGCGATPLAERGREEIRATGARPRSESSSGIDALTPSELRVARMAGDGLTNPEIAQTLFVTSKTVEFHLRHVFQKLDISSRRQLRGVLAA